MKHNFDGSENGNHGMPCHALFFVTDRSSQVAFRRWRTERQI